jgi:hypothetical protein
MLHRVVLQLNKRALGIETSSIARYLSLYSLTIISLINLPWSYIVISRTVAAFAETINHEKASNESPNGRLNGVVDRSPLSLSLSLSG